MIASFKEDGGMPYVPVNVTSFLDNDLLSISILQAASAEGEDFFVLLLHRSSLSFLALSLRTESS